jgi:signal transduction histidine kinase/CheY-like chemotaxis protein/PAS domain-containing protein
VNERLQRLEVLVDNTDTGYLVEDGSRHIDLVNQRFLDIFGVPGTPAEMQGTDCSQAAEQSADLFVDPAGFLLRVDEVLADGHPVRAERLVMVDGRVLERDYLPVHRDAELIGHLWGYRDVTAAVAAVARVDELNGKLSDVWQLQQEYLIEGDATSTYWDALGRLLATTGSGIGFVGECGVVDGNPVLIARALTDISWDEPSREIYRSLDSGGFIFSKLDSLFGVTLVQHTMVISNDPSTDPRRGGLPPGHPGMTSYLGIPLFAGDEMIGMVGLGNRAGGFDEEVAAGIEPILTTLAAVMSADRSRRAIVAARHRSDDDARAMSRFLSTASHELRTPLNAVVGFAELLAREEVTDEQRQWVDQIRLSASHLVELVTRVLDLTKLESGAATVAVESLALAEVVSSTVASFTGLAASRGAQVIVAVGDSHVLADPVALREVVSNLVDNALKFGATRVDISAIESDATVSLSVRDNGPGIPSDLLERVFVPFDRLGRGADVPGSGLGLALTKHLVEAMSGTITMTSSVGGGAQATVNLVAATPAHPVTPPNAGPGALVGQLSCERVLHVEDNAVNVALMAAVFGKAFPGVVVDVAGTLSSAVAAINAHDYGLVLLDVHLSDGSSGLDLIPLLPEPRPRVVVISADSAQQLERAAALPGVDAFLPKPATLESLVAAITGD